MKIFFRNFRRGLILGVVIVAASLVVWFGYSQWKLLTFVKIAQSHVAAGVLKEANNGRLIILGSHIYDDSPNVIDYSQRQDFTVVVNSDTKFLKLVWYFPESLESITKNGVQFQPAEIKKEKLTGSIDELKNIRGVPVTVKTESNTIKKTTFEAMEVEYVVFVYAK